MALSVLLLAFVKALLTFIPAYVLSRIIHSLEATPVPSAYLPSIILNHFSLRPTLPSTPVDPIHSSPTQTEITLCIALALSSALSGIISSHQAYWDLEHVSEPIKIQLRALLFQKTLRKKDVVADEGGGKTQVLNLFTVDVARLAGFGNDAAGVMVAVVDLVIGTVLLYKLLGSSAFIGILLNTASIPLNKSLASVTFDVDRRRSLARDRRIAGVDEVLGGIRTVKFDAAEEYWEDKLGRMRKEEVSLQRVRYHLGTLYNLIWLASLCVACVCKILNLSCKRGSLPILCLLITFTVFTKVQHGLLTPSIAFPSLAIFNSLTQVWTILPGTFIKLTEGLVSLKRLASYLDGPEVDLEISLLQEDEDTFGIDNATISYPSNEPNTTPEGRSTPLTSFALRSVSVTIPSRSLTLVCGPVAAGKSLFLLGLLGEVNVNVENGSMKFPQTIDSGVKKRGLQEIREEEWLVEGSAFVPQVGTLSLPDTHSSYWANVFTLYIRPHGSNQDR